MNHNTKVIIVLSTIAIGLALLLLAAGAYMQAQQDTITLSKFLNDTATNDIIIFDKGNFYKVQHYYPNHVLSITNISIIGVKK